jgi:hypothetical protein
MNAAFILRYRRPEERDSNTGYLFNLKMKPQARYHRKMHPSEKQRIRLCVTIFGREWTQKSADAVLAVIRVHSRASTVRLPDLSVVQPALSGLKKRLEVELPPHKKKGKQTAGIGRPRFLDRRQLIGRTSIHGRHAATDC